MTRCAIYIRVSTEEQKINGLSIETQKNVLTEYAKNNNMQIVDYYIDAGLTARKKLSHRKGLLRLMEDVENGHIDLIIFTKLDRWFRNISDYYKIQDKLDKYKVNWKTIFENYDTLTANGRLHVNIMLSIAQDEADRTSERIKLVFENKRSKGETPAWKSPLGYKIVTSKLLIDDDTKEIAIDIFNYYDTHRSIMGCVRLAREKYGLKIYDYSIRRMLENKTYIGEFRGIEDFCEPLISQIQFNRIQDFTNIREFKNRLVAGRVYLFTSLVRCKECGHAMTTNFSVMQQKHGIKEFHYYLCKEYRFGECSHRIRINEEKLERKLLDHLIPSLKSYVVDIERSSRQNATKSIDIEKIKKRLAKLKDLYLDDLISKIDYKLEYDSLQKQLKDGTPKTERAIEKYQKIISCDIISLYNSFSQDEKKIFWLGIINRIVVDKDNNIEVYYQ